MTNLKEKTKETTIKISEKLKEFYLRFKIVIITAIITAILTVGLLAYCTFKPNGKDNIVIDPNKPIENIDTKVDTIKDSTEDNFIQIGLDVLKQYISGEKK